MISIGDLGGFLAALFSGVVLYRQISSESSSIHMEDIVEGEKGTTLWINVTNNGKREVVLKQATTSFGDFLTLTGFDPKTANATLKPIGKTQDIGAVIPPGQNCSKKLTLRHDLGPFRPYIRLSRNRRDLFVRIEHRPRGLEAIAERLSGYAEKLQGRR
jgi:hypothetical protein